MTRQHRQEQRAGRHIVQRRDLVQQKEQQSQTGCRIRVDDWCNQVLEERALPCEREMVIILVSEEGTLRGREEDCRLHNNERGQCHRRGPSSRPDWKSLCHQCLECLGTFLLPE